MKITEIKEMSTAELTAKVTELKEQLFVLKFQQATGKVEGVANCKNIRKDIARILTVLNERAAK